MGSEQPAFKLILKSGTTAIGNLTEAKISGMKIEFKDTTYHGLTVAWRTFRAVMGDAGEIEFKVQMTAANVAALFALFDPALAMSAWSITFPFTTPIVATFATAQLAEFAQDGDEVDGILMMNLKLKLSGAPAIA